MGAIFGVEVPGRAGHSEASEAQLREGDRAWGGSVERKPWGTRTACEAAPARASRHATAKLSWPRARRR